MKYSFKTFFTQAAPDELELVIDNSNYQFEIRDGKPFIIKKSLPKTFKECCEYLNIDDQQLYVTGYKSDITSKFRELLICRNAYWEYYNYDGFSKNYYIIFNYNNTLTQGIFDYTNAFLRFPTKEIRDEFVKNFKPLLKECLDFI